jgi:hypothetical protein
LVNSEALKGPGICICRAEDAQAGLQVFPEGKSVSPLPFAALQNVSAGRSYR